MCLPHDGVFDLKDVATESELVLALGQQLVSIAIETDHSFSLFHQLAWCPCWWIWHRRGHGLLRGEALTLLVSCTQV